MPVQRKSTPPLTPESALAIAEALEADLFHRFSDCQLLARAFVHPSAVSGAVQSNQRLEFLGDRVLGLAVAEMLYARYPGESEGALAPRFIVVANLESADGGAAGAGLLRSWASACGVNALTTRTARTDANRLKRSTRSSVPDRQQNEAVRASVQQ